MVKLLIIIFSYGKRAFCPVARCLIMAKYPVIIFDQNNFVLWKDKELLFYNKNLLQYRKKFLLSDWLKCQRQAKQIFTVSGDVSEVLRMLCHFDTSGDR